MASLEVNTAKAVSLCEGNCLNLKEYERIYSFTTENISGYLDYFDLKDRSLMTVGSSGDQVINAYLGGAKDITLCDINPYAKYYTYLKIAAIMTLTYTEFKKFFFVHGIKHYYNKNMFSKYAFDNFIKLALRVIDYESYLFFDELFSTFNSEDIRNRLFNDDECRPSINTGFNNYLHNEESYNKLKKMIRAITFKYINKDLYNDQIPGTYDNVFLSNLSNVKTFDEYLKLLQKIDENNLNPNGVMQIAYLWDININSTDYQNDWFDIYKLPIAKKRLGDFLTESHAIPSCKDILWEEDKKRDLVLIYRK